MCTHVRRYADLGQTMTAQLLDIGSKLNELHPSMYRHEQNKGTVVVHVDDVLSIGASTS